MARRSEQVNIRVTPSTLDDWKAEVSESNEYNSVADLVRHSVSKEITGGLDREAVEQLDLEVDTDNIIETVQDAKEEILDEVDELDRRLVEVENEVATDDEIANLANDIVNELPVYADKFNPDFEPVSELKNIRLEHTDEAKRLSNKTAWAKCFDVDESKVQRALARAQDFPDVHYYEDGSMRRYFKTSDKI